ncbi:nuclear transport factor 2 family protein [Kineosporia sp. R_H_3]|uniref:nuclear transport factor 2 family protein n=1 Tax=Kineosporia sp. R_H_3 TaxID=1961848 RepID=UPI00130406FE|nr:nuclear transport factor 2 family protein [Kineosporia sp. R_H_3]
MNTPINPKVEAVQRMYEAFGRGDVDAILAELADDVEWVSVTDKGSATVPWYGSYRGRSEVPLFFKRIGSAVQVNDFSALSFTSNDTDVMVALQWGFTVNATGKNVSVAMQHWFRFDDGKIIAARVVEDSEQTAAAFS